VPIWSGKTSIYEINPDPNSNQKFREVCSIPQLGQNVVQVACSWVAKDMLYLGDSTGKAYLWDIKTQAPGVVQNLQHMSPIKDVVYNQTVGNLITSG